MNVFCHGMCVLLLWDNIVISLCHAVNEYSVVLAGMLVCPHVAGELYNIAAVQIKEAGLKLYEDGLYGG